MKNKNLYSIIGFLLFVLGFSSLALRLIGIRLVLLLWMDYFGPGVGFLLNIIMIVSGFVIIYLAKTDWEEE
jgi:hypothetical protein